MDYMDAVRSFIVDTFLFGEGDQIKGETSFLESGIIDSTGILELVTFLEKTYGIQIQDDELVPENLDSIVNVAGFLEKRVQSAA